MAAVRPTQSPSPEDPPRTTPERRDGLAAVKPAPGTEKPRRFRPSLRFELISCGLHGHELIGTNARTLRPEDAIFAREDEAGFRWYRCVRCDAWLPLAGLTEPTVDRPAPLESIELPLRGRPLHDRYMLRVIAVERATHVIVLGLLAVAIFAFAAHRQYLHHEYTRILADLQGGLGGPVASQHSWIVSETNKLFSLSTAELYWAGIAVTAYTAVLVVEMVGLWWSRRWAEYLTLLETSVLVPFEIYELSVGFSYLKILTLLLNLAIVAYLLFHHRLFGVRGGASAIRQELERDTGWAALEPATPPLAGQSG